MDDNNEQDALRELQEEARRSSSRTTPQSETSSALADSVKLVVLGVLGIGALVVGYFWLTDPCFDFKLSVIQQGAPDAWRIWAMDCSR